VVSSEPQQLDNEEAAASEAPADEATAASAVDDEMAKLLADIEGAPADAAAETGSDSSSAVETAAAAEPEPEMDPDLEALLKDLG
jgi:hypothetical protein